jgi:glycosyltransferase involved in cell wall biosynthesis
MRIAVVVTGGLHPSGREQVVPSWLALLSRLASRHEIHAFALKHLPEPQTYSLLGFTVHDLGRPSAVIGPARWVQQRALWRALNDAGHFDLVHGFWGDPAGQFAVWSAQRRNVPSIATLDSGEFVSLPDIAYGSQRTLAGRRAVSQACSATRIHVCSRFMAGLAAAHGVQATTIIPLTTVSAPARTRAPVMAGSTLRLIQVASLSQVKNQQMLIDALAILTRSIDAHLDLVGEDTLDGMLQRHAAARGVSDRVTFHGFVAQDRLATLLDDADAYVQSSRHEAAGVSVLEAAAAGLPVVGTRAGYLADWAPDQAMVIERMDAGSLADAILALRNDHERARAMAWRSQAWALAHDAAWVADQFDELYRNTADAGITPST